MLDDGVVGIGNDPFWRSELALSFSEFAGSDLERLMVESRV